MQFISAPPTQSQTSSTPNYSHLTLRERQVADQFSLSMNIDSQRHCVEDSEHVLAALTELANVLGPFGKGQIARTFTNATGLWVGEVWLHESGFLIELPFCRVGSISHVGTQHLFFIVPWRGNAEAVSSGMLTGFHQFGDKWLLMLSSGMTYGPYQFWMLYWDEALEKNALDAEAKWVKVKLEPELQPYSLELTEVNEVTQTATIQMWHGWGDTPCTFTDTFNAQYTFMGWTVQNVYDLSANSFRLIKVEALHWDVRDKNEKFQQLSDWQQYCVKTSGKSAVDLSRLRSIQWPPPTFRYGNPLW